jgi:hypothetical protein
VFDVVYVVGPERVDERVAAASSRAVPPMRMPMRIMMTVVAMRARTAILGQWSPSSVAAGFWVLVERLMRRSL